MFLHHITRHRQTTKSTEGVVCASLFLGIWIKIRALTSDGYPLFFCFSSCVISLQICFEQKNSLWLRKNAVFLASPLLPPSLPRPLAQWKKRLITSYWQTGSLSLIRPYLDAYGKIEVNFKKVQKFLFEKKFASVLLGSQVNGGIGREDSRGEYPLRRAHKMVLHLPLTPPIESPKSSYPL